MRRLASVSVLSALAAVAAAVPSLASTVGVTIPFAAGPGGGGFMVVYLAHSHQIATIAGRENC